MPLLPHPTESPLPGWLAPCIRACMNLIMTAPLAASGHKFTSELLAALAACALLQLAIIPLRLRRNRNLFLNKSSTALDVLVTLPLMAILDSPLSLALLCIPSVLMLFELQGRFAWVLAMTTGLGALLGSAALHQNTPLLLAGLPWALLIWLLHSSQRQRQILHDQIPGIESFTGLRNKSALMHATGLFIPYQQRNQTPFMLAVICLEHYENNHLRSRRILENHCILVFARLLENRLRRSDVLTCIAPNTFAILLTDTSANGADVAIRDLQSRYWQSVKELGMKSRAIAGISPLPDAPLALDHQIGIMINILKQTQKSKDAPTPPPVFIDTNRFNPPG